MANQNFTLVNNTMDAEIQNVLQIFSFPPGIVDAQTASDVAEAVYCYILPVLVVVGVTGNVLTLVVLCVQKKKDSITTSLTALAIADTGYIVTTFVRQISCLISKYDAILARNYSTLMYGQMIVVNITFSRISAVVTAVISTERSLAVIMPLKVRNLMTNQRMVVIFVVVYISSIALIGPVFFMGESYWTTSPRTNTTYVMYSYTRWYLHNQDFADVYRDIFLNVLFRFLPTALVCVNTATIIQGVRKSRAWRKEMASKDDDARRHRETKMNLMLLAICIIFLLCTLPGLVFQVFTFSTDQFSVFGRYRNMYKLASAVSLTTQFINSSVNFIVYILLNDRFLRTFQQLFGCDRDRQAKNLTGIQTSKTKATDLTKSVTSPVTE